MSSHLTLLAPAKVNLGLEVIRRRDDGFHDVNTIYAAVDLCDEITLLPRDDREIVCIVEGDVRLEQESSEENLCVRAARAVQELAQVRDGMTILLRKRIPTGAGLGGGSSDAAALLLGAARFWETKLSVDDLFPIASRLGSDVPFFLNPGIANATSRGEILTPLTMSLPWSLLLVNPGIHVPTPWAYRAVNRTEIRPATDLIAALRTGIDDPSILRERVVNDFEKAVFVEYPQLQGIKDALYDAGALFALMSGSGSTLFGLFDRSEKAEAAQRHFSEYWSRVVGFCGRGPADTKGEG